MFGIGMPEMLVLLAVALIIFGPKKLPDLAKSLGRALGDFKRATSDLKQNIETETGVDEVRHSLNEVKEDIQSQVDLAGSVPDPSDPLDEAYPKAKTDEPLDDAESDSYEMEQPTDPPQDPIDPDTGQQEPRKDEK